MKRLLFLPILLPLLPMHVARVCPRLCHRALASCNPAAKPGLLRGCRCCRGRRGARPWLLLAPLLLLLCHVWHRHLRCPRHLSALLLLPFLHKLVLLVWLLAAVNCAACHPAGGNCGHIADDGALPGGSRSRHGRRSSHHGLLGLCRCCSCSVRGISQRHRPSVWVHHSGQRGSRTPGLTLLQLRMLCRLLCMLLVRL